MNKTIVEIEKNWVNFLVININIALDLFSFGMNPKAN